MRNSKFWKRITTTVAALSLVAGLFAGVAPIDAETADTGSITVHKYKRSTIGSDNDQRWTGDELSAADTANFGAPGAGAGFTLYSIDLTNFNSAVADGYGYYDGVSSYTINESAGTVTWTIHTAASGGTSDVITMPYTQVGTEQITNSSGIASFSNLPIGYYVLIETTGIEGYTKGESSIIRMPLTSYTNNEANYNIHVYPKNVSSDTPIYKVINGDSKVVVPGDTISYTVGTDFRSQLAGQAEADKVNSVADLKDGSNYGTVYIVDAIATYFSSYTLGDVYLVDSSGAKISPNLTAAQYTSTETTSGTTGSKLLRVTLTNAGIDAAIAANAGGFAFDLSATFGASWGGTEAENVSNKAVAVVTKAGTTPPTTPPDPEDPDPEYPTIDVEAPTASVALIKYDGEQSGKVPLAGTKWRLALVATPSLGTASDYVCGADGQPLELETGSNGKISFNGVPYTDAGATYYLQEVKTVNGYSLPMTTTPVTLAAKTHASNASNLNDDNEWIEGALVTSTVEAYNYINNPTEPIFKLPLTGGMGTLLFTIAGIVLMLGAALIYVRSRRRA
ncbi:MAG: SpaH/EbpB family LPXTG-anchored major pilin [Suipraeoptans sp.]